MLTRSKRSRRPTHGATWKLQDAKARFSEVVRRAETQGPQHVTVHGKPRVVVVAAEEFSRAVHGRMSGRTGADLVAAMQQGRKLGLRLKPMRVVRTYRPAVDFSGD